ncbi:MAG: hypothetical protein COA88_12990 [Kordia sp.]|nr:MAG: hypothetical protein COA88_12990 [Kordia sp.]
MATIIGYSEVEAVYQTFITNGTTVVFYAMSYTLAIIITVWKIVKAYWQEMEQGKVKDMKKFVTAFKPILPMMLVMAALPFIISLVESLFANLEANILDKTGSAPEVLSYMESADEEAAKMDEAYGLIWSVDQYLSYFMLTVLKPIMIFIENYLFSMALAGRYVYLILLELIAPLAIVSLLFDKSHDIFWGWFKNMLVCYLLVPGFMIANYFADQMWNAFYDFNDDNGDLNFLFIIALKLFLYKVVASRTSQLIR